jgi:hypothetical protein
LLFAFSFKPIGNFSMKALEMFPYCEKNLSQYMKRKQNVEDLRFCFSNLNDYHTFFVAKNLAVYSLQ